MRVPSILLAALLLSLAGCSTAPSVKYSFPDAPAELMVAPAPLKTLRPAESLTGVTVTDSSASDVKLSEVLKTITENYKISNQYKEQILSLQSWINAQKANNP